MGGVGGMLPRKFVGRLSADGSQIVGTFGFPDGIFRETPGSASENPPEIESPPYILTKTTGESCSQAIRPGSPNTQ
jgi:hypothetical protein